MTDSVFNRRPIPAPPLPRPASAPPEPIRQVVERWGCPFCPRNATGRLAIVKHMPHCWRNPELKTCFSCAHHTPDGPGLGGCGAGVNLVAGRKSPPIDCPAWKLRRDEP